MSEENYKKHLYALILAGGGGTRLWPRSREKTPKQFLKLFGGKTLTQITAKRFRKILPWQRIYCVTVSDAYKRELLRELPGFVPGNIIVEPARRETGPAHGIGAVYIQNRDPDAVIITESVDRLVKPVPTYLKTLKVAAQVAYDQKVMVAIGVEPRYPNVGYGHIKKGAEIDKVNGVKFFKLEKFVEKPPLALAKKYTSSGKYLWNAGQFVWRADVLLASIKKHEPKISSALDKISGAIGTENEKEMVARVYKSMPKISIDYAVAERDRNFVLVSADFFWTDIGDWKEVWENLAKDNVGNVIIDGDEPGGEVINIDTSDALVHKDGRLIALVDVDNIIIVDTKDALLVCSKSMAQNVKKIVQELKERKDTSLL
ncbi:MAG: Mannose-1-phosphate guanylyltransferase (GDP) [Candidatus Woesebacteria bacterium GW2011_GWB1_43_14]|uniref:Mannose-1-phosphate guanylyltransferase (GDP) n=1 Tax=Candidatus Woesebacteria bacterium GW2011_GWB1_43_14 TaxID=1618578 RepID=A0A0G1GE80_9BACT|nr:MAG: Mannose-1-phosphate guanylyltransferase (GDP) [Candidatus Woesebacteria bacterium GW2011_GWA1_39_11b]KKS78410.1 MAG: Mannose-1-phosphate guanylyltransferase (GDP) [Candidatus Woesebacteria bacterium GW2011_GWC1_42_9]KKS97173.1 MAG: Mannose-1-phosphate guanylyltransferase (GDP) [Candidatus Woesebacteria bacterium GW2011_GWB1_43_14]